MNLGEHLAARNVNMITCGGQATIPMVHAVSRVTPVPYAEIVASIASRSAGPGTRANIDEFTATTARAIERVGGAQRGKAIIILNPVDPPAAAEEVVAPFIPRLPWMDRSSIVQGYAGVYSSFLLHAQRAAERYGVPTHAILQRVGEAGVRRRPGGHDHRHRPDPAAGTRDGDRRTS